MQALNVLCLCGIEMINHIGKEEKLCSCGFFIPFLSFPIRVQNLKEGDRMGHKDDVLMDGSLNVRVNGQA